MATTMKQTLQARLDVESKKIIKQAAALRRVGLSDYVRLVLVPAARQEVEHAKQQVIHMTPVEQEAFWKALQSPSSLTAEQKRLASIMRGEE